jgi:hypothetical protein
MTAQIISLAQRKHTHMKPDPILVPVLFTIWLLGLL